MQREKILWPRLWFQHSAAVQWGWGWGRTVISWAQLSFCCCGQLSLGSPAEAGAGAGAGGVADGASRDDGEASVPSCSVLTA